MLKTLKTSNIPMFSSKKDVPIRLETGQKAGVRPSRVVNLHVGAGLEELRWLLEDLIKMVYGDSLRVV